MHRISRSCSGSAPMSIPGRPLPTRVTPARPTDKRRAHGASSPLFRERPTKRASRASSQRPSTKGVRVSSRRSESSSASSVSPYDARRRGATSHPSSHSQPVSPWSNPSTQPSVTLSKKAAAKLAAEKEGIVVYASYYGDPKKSAEKHADEVGQIDL